MLIEFSVSNYKSFRDRVTFSMIAANLKSPDPKLDESNTIKINDKLSLLTTAAIYGKNASGKSNLGAALKFMREYVLAFETVTQPGKPIFVYPFMLNTVTREQPSLFEVLFLLEGKQYRYGFEVNRERVMAEWLYHVPNAREVLLFERKQQAITIKPGFKEGRSIKKTPANALFVSVVAQFEGNISKQISDWFSGFNVTSGLNDDDFYDFTLEGLREDESLGAGITNFMNSTGVDLSGLALPDIGAVEHIIEVAPTEHKGYVTEKIQREVLALHPLFDADGKTAGDVRFAMSAFESQGTRKLFAMSGPMLSTLAHGLILFIDEFDARLHTEMTRAIAELFQSKETNPKGAQLIFVTHDTNLLDNTLLRRDQIWFAEKDKYGATSLTSLAEYNERNDANFESRYLGGRYGGVPSLGGLKDSVRNAQKAMEAAANA